jgi:hypothetical protein
VLWIVNLRQRQKAAQRPRSNFSFIRHHRKSIAPQFDAKRKARNGARGATPLPTQTCFIGKPAIKPGIGHSRGRNPPNRDGNGQKPNKAR